MPSSLGRSRDAGAVALWDLVSRIFSEGRWTGGRGRRSSLIFSTMGR